MNMEKINKKPKRTFIPQSIGDTVKKINRNYVSKFGKIEFIIHSNWAKIVGSYFADFSQPKNVSQVYDSENDIGEHIYKRYLNVSVAPAAALVAAFSNIRTGIPVQTRTAAISPRRGIWVSSCATLFLSMVSDAFRRRPVARFA